MLRLRKAGERGGANHGWLDTRHTFSFGDYHDPAHMGFRSLRVMNEDWIAPTKGFGMHGHRDMEIVTYVLEGALEHQDSMGNGETLRPGEFQRMSAGTGVRHSEFNPSASEPVHLYQIWLTPKELGVTPSYEQKFFPEEEKQGRFRIVASPDGREGSLTIHQNAKVCLASIAAGESAAYALPADRHAWLQVLRGSATVNGLSMQAGDGLAASDEPSLEIVGGQSAEVMLFDLA